MNQGMVNYSSGFAAVNGGTIYYEVAGEGEAILFIHGLFLDSRLWEEQFHEFSKKYKVVRFDLRGFGSTKITEEPFSNYDDIKALLQYLEIEKAHIVGLSLGAYLALEVAIVYPEIVQSLTLCSFKLSRIETEELNAARQEFMEAAKQGEMNRCIDLSEQMWLYGPVSSDSGVSVSDQNRELYRTMLEQNFNLPKIASKPIFLENIGERSEEMTAKTLVIYGAHDFQDYVQAADRLTQQLKNSKKVCFSRSAHVVNLTEPINFNQVLAEFIIGLE